MAITGRRIADEGIYLKEDRYDRPKEYFKLIGRRMAEDLRPGDRDVLDVGCATGELIHYLKGRWPGLAYTGVDVSARMIKQARARLPDCRFEVGSLTAARGLGTRRFDVVICAGTLQIFDDLARPMARLARVVRPGGRLYIFTIVNWGSVDLITRYRDRRHRPGVWQKGWNIFSREAFEEAIRAAGRRARLRWDDFRMSFSLAAQKNPMRTWTVPLGREPFQLVNGAGMIIDLALLTARFSQRQVR
ncbi:MAG: class I SAM-dependent methyltransferase [Elusimicrobia bacterium]|nr:class I SAM-dependent methyltransferase [Elusimicrobiota bacterium]